MVIWPPNDDAVVPIHSRRNGRLDRSGRVSISLIERSSWLLLRCRPCAARIRSWNERCSRAAAMSRTTWVSGVGELGLQLGVRPPRSPATPPPGTAPARAPLSVSATVLVRASAPGELSTRPSRRIAVIVWLIAEWVTSTSAASSRMVSGPRWRSLISVMLNRGRTPAMPRSRVEPRDVVVHRRSAAAATGAGRCAGWDRSGRCHSANITALIQSVHRVDPSHRRPATAVADRRWARMDG